VGSRGVFAVETKVRSKPSRGRGREDATVEYNGRVLEFPNWTDAQIIEQAERQADWLSEWVGRAIGEPVAARAIVALPGWFVKRTTIDGIPWSTQAVSIFIQTHQTGNPFGGDDPADCSPARSKVPDVAPSSSIYDSEETG